jgi:hypothetical protein
VQVILQRALLRLLIYLLSLQRSST